MQRSHTAWNPELGTEAQTERTPRENPLFWLEEWGMECRNPPFLSSEPQPSRNATGSDIKSPKIIGSKTLRKETILSDPKGVGSTLTTLYSVFLPLSPGCKHSHKSTQQNKIMKAPTFWLDRRKKKSERTANYTEDKALKGNTIKPTN